MAVYVVRFKYQQAVRWGVIDEQSITPIEGTFETTGELIQARPVESLKELTGPTIPLAEVKVLSPVTRNQKFICLGANYRQHMIESGMDPDAKHYNMIFTKAASAIVPAASDVVIPKQVRLLDYEIELGIVLKEELYEATSVTVENLHRYVAGVVIVNDYSARDIQIPQTQFHKGKSFRTFGPVGPILCLFERADYAQLDNLQLELRVNGAIRQSDLTANMVYKPAETLTELSGVFDLAPGDLISTGTPAGCALAVPSQADQKALAALPVNERWKLFIEAQAKREQYLRPGDVVEATIFSLDHALNLGTQRNHILAAA